MRDQGSYPCVNSDFVPLAPISDYARRATLRMTPTYRRPRRGIACRHRLPN